MDSTAIEGTVVEGAVEDEAPNISTPSTDTSATSSTTPQSSRELARTEQRPEQKPMALSDFAGLAKHFARSGYFADARDESKAIVKIVYGAELGISPCNSMLGIHVIEGKPSLSANLIATLIKRSKRYNYRVDSWSNHGCHLTFFEGGVEMGQASFDREDAELAECLARKNWKHYPKAMFFARALTIGARTYCPDIFGGAPVYTAEELGAEVDGEGNVIAPPPGRTSLPPRLNHPTDPAEPASPEIWNSAAALRDTAVSLGYRTPQGKIPPQIDDSTTHKTAMHCVRFFSKWIKEQNGSTATSDPVNNVEANSSDNLPNVEEQVDSTEKDNVDGAVEVEATPGNEPQNNEKSGEKSPPRTPVSRFDRLSELHGEKEAYHAFVQAAAEAGLPWSTDQDLLDMESVVNSTFADEGETILLEKTEEKAWDAYAGFVADGFLSWGVSNEDVEAGLSA